MASLVRPSRRVLGVLESCGIHNVYRDVLENYHTQQQSTALSYFLGLDINTKTTGYAVLNGLGEYHCSGYIKTPKGKQYGDLIDVGREISSKLQHIHHEVLTQQQQGTQSVRWFVGIEDYMKTMGNQKFHTKGLFQLAQLNGIVSYCCHDIFDTKPCHVHPNRARSMFDIQSIATSTSPGQSKSSIIKEQVVNFVRTRHPDFQWLVKDHKGKKNPTEPACFAEENYDIADAYVIALYRLFSHVTQATLEHSGLKSRFHAQYYANNTTRLDKKKSVKDREVYIAQVFHNAVKCWIKDHQDQFYLH